MTGHGPKPIAAAYAELELPPSAPLEEVKKQYRLLSVAWHPDKWPEGRSRARAEEKMKRVNSANDLLQRHLKDRPEAENTRREQEYRHKLARIEQRLAEDVKAACERILEQQRPLLEAADSARRDLAHQSEARVADIRAQQSRALHDSQAAMCAKALTEVAVARSSARRARDDQEAVRAVVGVVRAARADLQAGRRHLAEESSRRIAVATEHRAATARELDAKHQALLDEVEQEIDSAAAAAAKKAAAARSRLLRECGMANDAT